MINRNELVEEVKYSSDRGLREIIDYHPGRAYVTAARKELQRRQEFAQDIHRIAQLQECYPDCDDLNCPYIH